MSNSVLTASIIAKEAVMILDNELVMAKKVFRGYENEFDKKVNGYKVGDTITVRKPTDYTVRDGAIMQVQDVVEGSVPIVVNQRKGVDFKFSSQDLTLKIGELSERVIKPAMVQLANTLDVALHNQYKYVSKWAGTPASPIDSFSDFSKGPALLDEYATPQDGRTGVLSPADHWGLLGSQTALYNDSISKPAYRSANTGMVAGVDLYMSQNVATHTTGTRAGSILIDLSITTSTITYDSVKTTNRQTIHIDALGGATQTIKAGDVFTIADVYAVNPVTKARLSFLKQFTVVEDAVGAGSECDLIITPAIIWTGAFKNVDVISSVTDLNDQAVTFMGGASTNWRQNMIFHKNAFALVTVPLVSPPGAVDVARETYKGTTVRVIPVYDGMTDESAWRLDILYGVATIDERLAVRLSGTT